MNPPLLEELPYAPDSGALFEAIADLPWAVFLDSGQHHPGQSRYDILAAEPYARLLTRGNLTEIQGDGVQLVGELATSGDELSANFVGYAPFGEKFDDGSTTGVGSLSGDLDEHSSISADIDFTTSRGDSSQSTIALTYDPIYERDSSLESVAGNYMDTERNVVINVNNDGDLFSQDSKSHCVTNGTVSVIDRAFNLYRVRYTFSNFIGTLRAVAADVTARAAASIVSFAGNSKTRNEEGLAAKR